MKDRGAKLRCKSLFVLALAGGREAYFDFGVGLAV